MLAEYIDSIIMFLAGAYFTAIAFGRLPPPSKDPVAGQQWLARFGKMLKVIGRCFWSSRSCWQVPRYSALAADAPGSAFKPRIAAPPQSGAGAP